MLQSIRSSQSIQSIPSRPTMEASSPDISNLALVEQLRAAQHELADLETDVVLKKMQIRRLKLQLWPEISKDGQGDPEAHTDANEPSPVESSSSSKEI